MYLGSEHLDTVRCLTRASDNGVDYPGHSPSFYRGTEEQYLPFQPPACQLPLPLLSPRQECPEQKLLYLFGLREKICFCVEATTHMLKREKLLERKLAEKWPMQGAGNSQVRETDKCSRKRTPRPQRETFFQQVNNG